MTCIRLRSRSFLVTLGCFLLVGCTSQAEIEHSRERKLERQRTVNACLDRGGIPIISSWDERIKSCQFAPVGKP